MKAIPNRRFPQKACCKVKVHLVVFDQWKQSQLLELSLIMILTERTLGRSGRSYELLQQKILVGIE